jgi:hypothetical protein
MEAAAPLPLISVERVARAEPDRPNVYVAMSRSASSLVWHQDRGGWVRVCMRYDSAKSRAGGSRLELGQGVVVDTPYCVVGASVSWARYSLWVA